MITQFKLFENTGNKVTLTINDIIGYFNGDNESISDFIFKLLEIKNNVIKFECKKCTEDIKGLNYFMHSNKQHKGVVRGFGYGFNKEFNYIFLTIKLKGIRYKHDVDTNSPMNIYGIIPDDIKDIIDEININKETKKFNL